MRYLKFFTLLLDGSACVLVGHWFWGAHAISPRYRVPFAAKPE